MDAEQMKAAEKARKSTREKVESLRAALKDVRRAKVLGREAWENELLEQHGGAMRRGDTLLAKVIEDVLEASK